MVAGSATLENVQTVAIKQHALLIAWVLKACNVSLDEARRGTISFECKRTPSPPQRVKAYSSLTRPALTALNLELFVCDRYRWG